MCEQPDDEEPSTRHVRASPFSGPLPRRLEELYRRVRGWLARKKGCTLEPLRADLVQLGGSRGPGALLERCGLDRRREMPLGARVRGHRDEELLTRGKRHRPSSRL